MDAIPHLDDAFAWTTARIAAVPADALDAATPCADWTVRELLDHTLGSLQVLTDAIAPVPVAAPSGLEGAAATGPPAETRGWLGAIAHLAERNRRAWATPVPDDRMFELPFGTMTAADVATGTLVELLVHGWDLGQASGERADIPDALAVPTLELARHAIADAQRGDAFGPALDLGATPSDRLVAFLGRTPR
ncbi:MAG TPA: TIGR03086 family metal-binding protein [Aquihabitans sp.]|jgi:uncharacterized protein (TIGR03086 family)|nr:TIGR03086 family metal-binding protein [Aquihabitans sp.]